jgi:SAM-dependent methyltransferase
MHFNALKHAKLFFETYCSEKECSVVEIGSFNVNGSIRDVITPSIVNYTGVDFAVGNGVDVVLEDPYDFPFLDNTFDVLVTSSCFEHSELFWLTFLESMRIVKPNGLVYINVPSSWMCFHQYPVDCWRFYPDSSRALLTWAKRNGMNAVLLESYICAPSAEGECSDIVMVFLKDANNIDNHPYRIVDNLVQYKEFFNAYRFPSTTQFPYGTSYPAVTYPQGVEHPLAR